MNPSEIPDDGELSDHTKPYKLGAVDASNSLIRLLINGSSGKTVTIHRWNVRVLDRKRPMLGYTPDSACCGGAQARFLKLDLDKELALWVDKNGKTIPPVTLTIAPGEQELVDILAVTQTCDCTWQVGFTYTVAGGDIQHRTVTGANPRFRTTAEKRATSYYPETDERTGKEVLLCRPPSATTPFPC